ncbi:MAG: hypothetical protein WC225_01645 [Acholeplasmataceae bacterium]|nr:hypothetical protein [Acholeplasmataceae bacterium]
MFNFAKWYISFLQEILRNIILFFQTRFSAYGKLFNFNNTNVGFVKFGEASVGFGIGGWIAAVIVIIVNALFIALFIVLLYRLFRRYVRFARREIEKDDLQNEIIELTQQLVKVETEKAQILSLQYGDGVRPFGSIGGGEASEEDAETKQYEGRFTKLIDVDETYQYVIRPTVMQDADRLTLPRFVDTFINFAASQLDLYYTKEIVAKFVASMATTKLLILEGISGTGKTSLPYAMGKFLSNDAAIISVQPSWTDRTELLGYLNEFTKKYTEPDFLKVVYETTYRTDVNLMILDEMNLARIEYYFADFLSLLEIPNPQEWLLEIVAEQLPNDPINLKKGKLLLPQNLWFVGTANRDDSTFTITDKVYDRAQSIEMNVRSTYIDAPYTNKINISYDYLNTLFENAIREFPVSNKTLEKLTQLDEFITRNFQVTFGNRIMRQIRLFLPVYIAAGQDELEGLDFLVARKVIRKFETLNLAFLKDRLSALERELDKIFGKTKFELTREMIKNYKNVV